MKIGLLPLYIELYDLSCQWARPGMDRFQKTIVERLRKKGAEVVTVPLCRLAREFHAAVKLFEREKVDAIVTLHLAYSPSLESIDALAGTRLPIVVLDTTPDNDFGPGQVGDKIMYNHGIHGVQDMCNMLLRRGKQFSIEAGHWDKSGVIDRVLGSVRAAMMARTMRKSRIGRIGASFKGMGDFCASGKVLRGAGIKVVQCAGAELRRIVKGLSGAAVRAEMAENRKMFRLGKITEELERNVARTDVVVDRWIRQENLTAFSMNFLEIKKSLGLPAVPFLAASKTMARGIGYAGEGDVLTAALVGALASAHPLASFVEMFCADWRGNSVFLSHMGEVNLRTIAGKPVLDTRKFDYTDMGTAASAVGCMKGGRAVFVNLAPIAGDKLRLIVAPVTMLDTKGKEKIRKSVRGWFRPAMPVSRFLEQYSRAGGTHHAALVYGDCAEEIRGFGELMGWDVVVIR